MINSWKKLIKIYVKDKQKIVFQQITSRIREIHDLEQQ
jgi:hypothetical protein